MNSLSKRLDTLIKLAEKGELIIDIGTDHAYVPISLIRDNSYHLAIASDINENALKIAKDNIELFNLSNRIKTVLSNGLESITDKADCITIAGMGGKLISRIIESDIDKIKQAKHLVLQPQKNTYYLRRKLLENGLYITKERLIFEDKHFYTIMQITQNSSIAEKMINTDGLLSYLEYGLLPLYIGQQNQDIFFDFLKYYNKKLKRILSNIELSKNTDKNLLKEIQKKLELNNCLNSLGGETNEKIF